MARKLGTTVIVGGTLLMLAGLIFLASSISQKQDESVSGLGSVPSRSALLYVQQEFT